MNPYYIETVLKEKQQDMLREAERQRLLAEYKASTPSRESKMLTVIGTMLIRVGEKLTQRYGRHVCSPKLKYHTPRQFNSP